MREMQRSAVSSMPGALEPDSGCRGRRLREAAFQMALFLATRPRAQDARWARSATGWPDFPRVVRGPARKNLQLGVMTDAALTLHQLRPMVR